MTKRSQMKFVHEGNFAAEMDVELIDTDDGWAPYLSLEDAYRLDELRRALRQGNIEQASKFARVFELVPVMA